MFRLFISWVPLRGHWSPAAADDYVYIGSVHVVVSTFRLLSAAVANSYYYYLEKSLVVCR